MIPKTYFLASMNNLEYFDKGYSRKKNVWKKSAEKKISLRTTKTNRIVVTSGFGYGHLMLISGLICWLIWPLNDRMTWSDRKNLLSFEGFFMSRIVTIIWPWNGLVIWLPFQVFTLVVKFSGHIRVKPCSVNGRPLSTFKWTWSVSRGSILLIWLLISIYQAWGSTLLSTFSNL